MQIKKTGENYLLTKRYYSRQKGKEFLAEIQMTVTETPKGKKVTFAEPGGNQDFKFIGSDPAFAEAIAGLIEYGCQQVVDKPWEPEGKE